MHHATIAPPANARAALRSHVIAAFAVALLLSVAWTVRDWSEIAMLNLPGNDDMMRLAQIRDWVAGQGFNDWTQYRLAPPEGAPMHWARINDAVPAAIILLLRPLAGTYLAELAAVIAYPAMLFFAYLLLSARIGVRLGGGAAALPAIVVAAIAYPASSLFLPGRIDHHALQIVLMLATILALMHRPSAAAGAVAGGGVALSFAIGLEGAPQAAAAMVALFVFWIVRGTEERARLTGFGAALAGLTLLLLAFARPTYWSAQWCDAFTPASTTATLVAGALWIGLGAATPWLRDRRLRLVAGGLAGAACLAALFAAYPGCVSGPYGPMDPFVRHAFMDNVLEARPLFEQGPFTTGIPSVGLMAAASIAAVWLAWRVPGVRMVTLPLFAALAISDLVVLVQVRGAYLGSALAAPILAQLILAARARGRTSLLVGAWIASAGMVYLLVPEAIGRMVTPEVRRSYETHRACNAGPVWQQIDRYPAGVVMAPMDRAAYMLGATHHSSVAAGYHRNNRGNRAMYDFFLAPPERARAIARTWDADYIVLCPTDFVELDVRRAYPESVAARLLAGDPPAWVEPLPLRDTGLRFYRIR